MTLAGPPHIVLIVLDTTGAGHLSLYGYSRPTTPQMVRLATECRVYTRCYAPGCWTVPSHASMFTGLYPGQHGACEGNFLIGDNLQHLTAVLKMAGYRTLGISSNGLVSPATGLCGAFDDFVDFGRHDLHRFFHNLTGEARKDPGELGRRLKQAVTLKEAVALAVAYLRETGGAAQLSRTAWQLARRLLRDFWHPSPVAKSAGYTEKTLAWVRRTLRRLAREPEQPFFLFINLMEAHQTYRPPLRWRRFSRWQDRAWVDPQRFYRRPQNSDTAQLVETYRNLYDDEILYQDDVLGRLWETLRQSPAFENTVVIVTSDHGEHLGEKGHYTHILSLYNELLWVPLIIRYPRGWAAPGTDDRLVSLTDLYATLLDLVGSPLPRPATSHSLLEPPSRTTAVAQLLYPEMWLTQWQHRARQAAVARETFSPSRFAVFLDNGLKILERWDGELEIYDLKKDPAEQNDLRPRLTPEALAEFRALVALHQEETGFWTRRREILQLRGLAAPEASLEAQPCAVYSAA
ncbi:MAG: sulfatase [Desulfobaccales bacterium]